MVGHDDLLCWYELQRVSRARVLRSSKSSFLYIGRLPECPYRTPINISMTEWTYSQSTGRLTKDGTLIATGYSGSGHTLAEGRDNPDMERVPKHGPIPEGLWKIGSPYDHPHLGPVVMNLEAVDANTFGRSLFRIHGDNAAHDASEGCIIMDRHTRDLIAASPVRLIRVIR